MIDIKLLVDLAEWQVLNDITYLAVNDDVILNKVVDDDKTCDDCIFGESWILQSIKKNLGFCAFCKPGVTTFKLTLASHDMDIEY